MTAYGRGGVFVVAAALSLSMIKCVFAALQYNVGEGCGIGYWSPKSGCDYNAWGRQYRFVVGDVLVFNFDPLESTLVIVKGQSDYDNCTLTNPSYIIYDSPPVTDTFLSSGVAHFVSVVGGICYQKMTVTVNDAPNSTPLVVGLVVLIFIIAATISLVWYCCTRRKRQLQMLNPQCRPNEGAPVLHAHVQQHQAEMVYQGAYVGPQGVPVTNYQNPVRM